MAAIGNLYRPHVQLLGLIFPPVLVSILLRGVFVRLFDATPRSTLEPVRSLGVRTCSANGRAALSSGG